MVRLERITGCNGLYGLTWLKYRETDYTGRWKIVKEGDHSELFIECFEIEEIDYKTDEVQHYSERTPFWSNIFNYLLNRSLEVETYESGISWSEGTKPHAVVRWVSEHKLLITQREEFINTCSGDCE